MFPWVNIKNNKEIVKEKMVFSREHAKKWSVSTCRISTNPKCMNA